MVCKKFYVEVLLRELGIDTVTFTSIGNSTYVPCHKSLQDIISEHQEFESIIKVLNVKR